MTLEAISPGGAIHQWPDRKASQFFRDRSCDGAYTLASGSICAKRSEKPIRPFLVFVKAGRMPFVWQFRDTMLLAPIPLRRAACARGRPRGKRRRRTVGGRRV